jgi:homopolymeric O-antigen transport system permease protein
VSASETTGKLIGSTRRSEPLWTDEFDLVLEATSGLRAFRFGELVRFRELLYFLTWRDIKVRYKQTVLGVGWAILQPVLTMILFTVVFGRVAKIGTGGIPYPIFSYTALVPWLFFANAVQLSSTSLTVNPQLITKVYFPRLYLVMAPVVAGIVDLGLAFFVLVGLMAYYGVGPDALGALLVVPLVFLAFVTTVGLSAWLAALNVRYRDVRFVVPFLVQSLLFATPVVYSVSSIGQPWRALFGLNPMTTAVEGFRWALAGGTAPGWPTVALSIVSGLVLLSSGFAYFHRTEKTFADVI